MSHDLNQALKSIHVFRSLPDPILDQLAAFASTRMIRTGETIFCQGEPSPFCFGILAGEVTIQHMSKDRRFPPKILGVVGAGETFGESAIFENSARQAMASASQDGKLVAIRGPQLREWISQHPDVSQALLLSLMKSVTGRLHRTSHELAVIYGVGRLLGAEGSILETLSATLEFLKGSIEGLDEVVLYQRSRYWEEFSPLVSLPVLQDLPAMPLTHAFVKSISESREIQSYVPSAVREMLIPLALPWESRASMVIIPLLNRDNKENPLEGLLCLASQQKSDAFSTEKQLLLASVAQPLAEALARFVRQEDSDAKARLQTAKKPFSS